MNTENFPREWVVAILIGILFVYLWYNGSLDNTTSAILLISIGVLLFLGSRHKFPISLEEAIEVSREKVYQHQKWGNIERGTIKFTGEADVIWDSYGDIFGYNVMFSVHNPSGNRYYIVKVSLYGAFMGITESKSKKSINDIPEDMKKVGFKPKPALREKEGQYQSERDEDMPSDEVRRREQ